jgi:hypothetical protein
MNKALRGGLLLGILAVMSTAWAAAPARTAESVTACMRANVPKSLAIKEVQLDATDASGRVRSLRGRLYATREDDRLRATMRIDAPSDLAGATYLLREQGDSDEMYVYIPAMQRVRRITGASVDGSLWGTDLSYGDVKQIGNVFGGRQPTLDADETIGGRPVHVLSALPGSSDSAKFTRVRAWVDQESCVTLRMDFFEGQTVRKRLSVDPKSLRRDGAYWYASQLQVSDLSQKTSTRLQMLEIHTDAPLAERLFSPATFYIVN